MRTLQLRDQIGGMVASARADHQAQRQIQQLQRRLEQVMVQSENLSEETGQKTPSAGRSRQLYEE